MAEPRYYSQVAQGKEASNSTEYFRGALKTMKTRTSWATEGGEDGGRARAKVQRWKCCKHICNIVSWVTDQRPGSKPEQKGVWQLPERTVGYTCLMTYPPSSLGLTISVFSQHAESKPFPESSSMPRVCNCPLFLPSHVCSSFLDGSTLKGPGHTLKLVPAPFQTSPNSLRLCCMNDPKVEASWWRRGRGVASGVSTSCSV